jgi:dolichol kinase
MIRKHELNEDFKLNGASWVLLSAVFCILVFPKIITVTGFTILIISDISAALFGRKFGKHKIFGKSYEGTLAFIVTAIGAVLFIGYGVSAPWTFFVMGIIAAVVAGIAELISKQIHVDDNLSIPISIGIVMWVGDYLFYHFAQISYLGFM